MQNKIKKGFTLAEMLLTVVIIGIISAIAIPSLKDTSDKTTNISLMKKAHSTITNAFAQLEGEFGTPIYWTVRDSSDSTINNKRVFSTATTDKGISFFLKKRISANANEIPDDYEIKTLNGDKFASGSDINTTTININGEGNVSFQSNDGMYWFPSAAINNCSYTKKDTNNKEKTTYLCGVVVVDINGNKKPNIFGIDVFVFDLTPEGVIAHSEEEDDCSSMKNKGYSCSSKILMEGEKAIDFIYE